MHMNTDCIEKEIVLRAPRTRVWRALTSAKEFGEWFNVEFDGGFAPGARGLGRITEPGYDHLTMEIVIEAIVPERLFSYHWHPNAVDGRVDYTGEPMTLVEFQLTEVDGGTRLTVVESGFAGIPLARRAEALRINDEGWAAQLTNIEQYVAA
ncbi:MAG: SRPBCC family protein [Dehalococcoidia bacterium]